MKFYDNAGKAHKNVFEAWTTSLLNKFKKKKANEVKDLEIIDLDEDLDDEGFPEVEINEEDEVDAKPDEDEVTYTCMCGQIRTNTKDPLQHCDVCGTDADNIVRD